MTGSDDTQFAWKRRPSEIRGYERAMYTTTDIGDYIRVDYNIDEKMVRLYVEVAEDKGASYYSVINKGRVTTEKNRNGRATRVADRLSERAEEFSSLPNKDVLKLIGGNYGIAKTLPAGRKSRNDQLKVERQEIKRKYFKPEDNPYGENDYYTSRYVSRLSIVDLYDIIGGIIIMGFFFYIGQYDLSSAGASSVIWGMLLGVFDILLREREPVFSKIFLFLISGVSLYFYSYLYL